MAGHQCRSKSTAKKYAMRMRNKGFNATVSKRKKGYGVSVTRR
jgi:hypothetical protein